MSRYTHFTKLKHLIFPNGGSTFSFMEESLDCLVMFVLGLVPVFIFLYPFAAATHQLLYEVLVEVQV
jgi:hypothetical protein